MSNESKECFLIVLSNSKDMNISVVTSEAWSWLEDGSLIPEGVNKDDLSSVQDINDRALHLGSELPSVLYTGFSVKDCIDFVQKNNLTIKDEFVGYLY